MCLRAEAAGCFQAGRCFGICGHFGARTPSKCSLVGLCPNPQPDCKTEKIRGEVLAAGGTWRDVARLPEAGECWGGRVTHGHVWLVRLAGWPDSVPQGQGRADPAD